MQPNATAFSARYRYHCHNSVMNASSASAAAAAGAPISINLRGPTTSISRPMIGASKPTVPTTTEKPNDTCARLQPNSSSSGITYAPNAPNVTPSASTSATTMPTSTHQP